MAVEFGDVAAVSGSFYLSYDVISTALCPRSGGMCDSKSMCKQHPQIAPGHLVDVSVLQEVGRGELMLGV